MLKANGYVTPVQEEPPQLKRHRAHRHLVWLIPEVSLTKLRNRRYLTISERKFAGHVLDVMEVLSKMIPMYHGKIPKELILKLVARIIRRENLLPNNKVPSNGVSSAMTRWVDEGWLGQSVLKK